MFLELLLVFLVMIIQVIIPPIPAEVIVIAAGKLYGVFLVTLVGGSGLWLGSVAVYFIGRYLHSRFDVFFGRRKVQHILEGLRHYRQWILWIRFLPYNPSDIISYAAGIARFDIKLFILVTMVTSYVRVFLLAWLGSSIESLSGVFVVFFLLFISALIIHFIFYYAKRKAPASKSDSLIRR